MIYFGRTTKFMVASWYQQRWLYFRATGLITCENDNANDASYLFLIDGIRLEQINGYKRFLISLMGMMRTQSLMLEQDGRFIRKKVCNPPIGKKMKMVNGLKHNNSLESEKQPFYECLMFRIVAGLFDESITSSRRWHRTRNF